MEEVGITPKASGCFLVTELISYMPMGEAYRCGVSWGLVCLDLYVEMSRILLAK